MNAHKPNKNLLASPALGGFASIVQVGELRAKGPGPYTVGEAAALLGVHPNTVLNWCSAGKLRFFRTPGGHRRIAAQALDEMLAATLAVAA